MTTDTDRIAALEAQNKALRKALETIESIDLQWADGLDSNVERIKTIARAALSLPAPEPEKVVD